MTPPSRRAVLVVAIIAGLLTVASIALHVGPWPARSAVAGTTATAGGLTAELDRAEWVDMGHVHDGQDGFLMPDQMMPGAPRGDEVRLGISLTLLNTDRSVREFNLAEEFLLTGGTGGERWPLRADSIGTLTVLAPGAGVRGTLYFDLEPPTGDDPPLYLEWSRGGSTVRIALPIDDQAPEHDH